MSLVFRVLFVFALYKHFVFENIYSLYKITGCYIL